ncbi:MAG: phosphorylcholine transferase LicD, partial [Anaerolineales bacterium]
MTKNKSAILDRPSKDIKPLHRVLTMIAEDLDAFCNRHEITYYLMGGTALGAVRHAGFIPWDDDFDIFMDRENYLKFLSVCELSLDRQKYYLQREDTYEWPLLFSKIRLNNTVYVERTEEIGKIHTGIYVDIMCLHNAYSNPALRYLQYLAARIVTSIALSRRGYNTSSRTKRFILAVASVLGRTPIRSLLLKFVRSLDGRDSEIVGHFFGRARFSKTSFPRHFLGKPRRIPFEATTFP